MNNNLALINQYGQSIWLDNLSRNLINSGDLDRLLKEDKISGITSNPAIFYNAFSKQDAYFSQINQLKQSTLDLNARLEELAITDVTMACDKLLSTYQETKQENGYVSLEVSPYLADDVAGTIKSALALHSRINRPNLMIKIPATEAGIKAFSHLISLGVNVNITLLFSLRQVKLVWEAYILGLKTRTNKGLDCKNIKAVASFFLSRIDSLLDSKLPPYLQGKTAINLAKAAYLEYQKVFNSAEFKELEASGAKAQYLLWASTGTKNPNYSDVLYMEELIGKNTINTAPDNTLDAFRDHGVAKERLNVEINQANDILAQVETQNIDLTKLGEELQLAGLKLFCEAYDKLLELVK